MGSKILFGKFEAMSFLVIIMTSQLFLGISRTMAEGGGTAGWILCLYATILALILFLIITRLYKGFEGKDLLDLGEITGGNVGRIIVGMVLMANYSFVISLGLRQFGEDIKIIALTQSPLSFVLLFFIIAMAVAAYFGIEAIARLGAILVPFIALGFIIIIAASISFADFTNIQPILGKGPYELFVKGISRVSIFSGISVLFLINPFIGSNKNMKSVGISSILISGSFITIGTLVYLLVFPYPAATANVIPIYSLSRLINYGRFFQRIESLFALIWTISALIYLSTGLFLIIYVFKKAFKLNYYRPLVVPISIIIFTLSFLPQSLMESMRLEKDIFRAYSWTVSYGLTLVLLIIGALLKRKRRGESK